MLITKEIEIRVIPTTVKHYKEYGYNFKCGDIITVDVNHLTESSTYKVLVKCDVCGEEKELSWNKYLKNISKYNLYTCSNVCSYVKNKKTCLEKYGDESFNNNEKRKSTNLEKYGVEYYSKTEESREKIKSTSLAKYGVESPNSSEEVKQNKRKSCVKKFGVDNYFKTEESKKFMIDNLDKHNKKRQKTYKETCLEKYGVEHISNIQEIRNKIKITNQNTYASKITDKNILSVDFDKKEYMCKCVICEKEFFIDYSLFKSRKKNKTIVCTICNPITKHISGLEIQLQNFIKENYSGKIILNSKSIIKPLELDVFLPELNLAFEFNGLFWHNENNRKTNYHQMKTDECEKQGIKLRQIFEDDWLYKTQIIKSIILDNIGETTNIIFSKYCLIQEISDNILIKDFLDNNHIQGYIDSKIKIGLFYNNELVSLMILNKKNNKYELLRFCNKLNINIIDSATTLFKYFINIYQQSEIITYADRSLCQGELYENLGFKKKGKIVKNYYYIVDGIKQDKSNYSKDVLVSQGYDNDKTEHEIMLERKIFRIYDSGKLKYNYV